MKYVMVRYTLKPDQVGENERLVRAVFAALERDRPAGIHYSTFRLPDGVSFVHLAAIASADGSNPLLAVEAFKQFSANIKDRCVEPPASSEVVAIGSYRMVDAPARTE